MPDFVDEQAHALRASGVTVDLFDLPGRALRAYLGRYGELRRRIRQGQYHIVHAHYGLSGFLCVLQRLCPTVVTFQGSDVNGVPFVRPFSRLAYRFSAHSIFVEKSMKKRIGACEHTSVIQYGIALTELPLLDKVAARSCLGLDPEAKLVLFASSADRAEKNYDLARAAVELIPGVVSLLELGGYDRKRYVQLLNAVDVFLMTSFSEGSPVSIKEAMAVNCPIVSTDVGDVRATIERTRGCFMTSYEPRDVADRLRQALACEGRTNGRRSVENLDNAAIAARLVELYRLILARQ
jgi:glycosyltransferase involved in cell wall biosynthesis